MEAMISFIRTASLGSSAGGSISKPAVEKGRGERLAPVESVLAYWSGAAGYPSLESLLGYVGMLFSTLLGKQLFQEQEDRRAFAPCQE